jgi:hypothetical protein
MSSSIKRTLAATAAAIVTAGLSIGVMTVAPVNSAVAPASASAAVKTYKNCTALNKAHKHGIKKSSTSKDVVRSGGKTIKKESKATTSKSLYNANKKLDRDKDGIACEK